MNLTFDIFKKQLIANFQNTNYKRNLNYLKITNLLNKYENFNILKMCFVFRFQRGGDYCYMFQINRRLIKI